MVNWRRGTKFTWPKERIKCTREEERPETRNSPATRNLWKAVHNSDDKSSQDNSRKSNECEDPDSGHMTSDSVHPSEPQSPPLQTREINGMTQAELCWLGGAPIRWPQQRCPPPVMSRATGHGDLDCPCPCPKSIYWTCPGALARSHSRKQIDHLRKIHSTGKGTKGHLPALCTVCLTLEKKSWCPSFREKTPKGHRTKTRYKSPLLLELSSLKEKVFILLCCKEGSQLCGNIENAFYVSLGREELPVV